MATQLNLVDKAQNVFHMLFLGLKWRIWIRRTFCCTTGIMLNLVIHAEIIINMTTPD